MNKNPQASAIVCMTLCVLVLATACTTTKQVKKTPVKRKSAQYVYDKLKKNELNYSWLSAKISTRAEIEGKKHEVTIKIRLRRDSVLWMSVSPALGIEFARIMISKDSVKYINRLEKTYYTGPINYLNKLAPIDITFDVLQAVITGNSSVKFEKHPKDKSEKFKASVNNGSYLLSTLNKRQYKKSLSGKKFQEIIVTRIWLDPSTFKIIKSETNNIASRKNVVVEYDEYKEVESQLFPHKVILNIRAQKSINVSLDYSRVSLEEGLKLPFSIPEKYDPIY